MICCDIFFETHIKTHSYVYLYTMSSQEAPPQPPQPPQPHVDDLLKVDVKTENDALNVLVQYLNVAQHRGAFSIAESSKIFECIKVFQRNPQ
jgi:hypothetical protein